MRFVDKEEIKSILDRHGVENGVNLRVVRSTKSLIRVVCDEGCPFVLLAIKDGSNIRFKIKTFRDEHSCVIVYKNRKASTKWLAFQFKEKVQEAPKFKITEMRKEIEREFKVHVSSHKCKRAKRRIMQEMEGSFKDEFGKLETYFSELRISNSVEFQTRFIC
ncbi:hypothetical protein QN277_019613 [Acacia crassicarpa]|uniref:Transposase MuDR plant domain-containing protein n=1 Tax=Acacia crassicarpa TaxID=499986 RepID=A0AAE1KBX0_9FABA|nr:hypothetical protein QN277_019613 [Acacia crassicarpa]